MTYYAVVDLHAITMPQDPKVLRQSKHDMAAALLACGVDPKQSVLFEQSKVRGHTELAWIFNCITPVGWLGRMTQWKSKIEKSHVSHAQALLETSNSASLKMGLFDYPVLQAADILIYRYGTVHREDGGVELRNSSFHFLGPLMFLWAPIKCNI